MKKRIAMNRRIYLYFTLSLLLWFSVLFFLLIASLSESIVHVSRISKVRSTMLMPEGWAFFTKNPREENFVMYKKEPGGWELKTIRAGSYRSIFGLNRDIRIANQELGMLLTNYTDARWVDLKGRINDGSNALLLDTLPARGVVDNSHYPIFSGDYILQKVYNVPWIWYTSNPDLVMDSKITKIRVLPWQH
jgi:antimicrobial peptide system SdpA family protein